jgi:hypothetical protein
MPRCEECKGKLYADLYGLHFEFFFHCRAEAILRKGDSTKGLKSLSSRHSDVAVYKKIRLRHEDVWASGDIAPPFLTSRLDGDEWSASCLGRFTRVERAPGTHWIGECVDSRAGPDAVGNRNPSPYRRS